VRELRTRGKEQPQARVMFEMSRTLISWGTASTSSSTLTCATPSVDRQRIRSCRTGRVTSGGTDDRYERRPDAEFGGLRVAVAEIMTGG
jgi:hypothetical protein